MFDKATTADYTTGLSGSFSASCKVCVAAFDPMTPNAIAASCLTNILESFFVASSNGLIPLWWI